MGVWVIYIREDNRAPGQDLKTLARTRIMPLHSSILDEGFLEYVKSLGNRPLFYNLKLDGYGRRSGAFTAIINEWLHETVGVTTTFYGYRRFVTSVLRNTLGPDGRPAVDGDIQPQLWIRLEALACERDGRLARPESVSDEAGQDMDHGVDHRPVA